MQKIDPKIIATSGMILHNGGTGFNDYPTHAVVRLRSSDDICRLLRVLVEHGYPDVSFMSGYPDGLRSLNKRSTQDAAVQVPSFDRPKILPDITSPLPPPPPPGLPGLPIPHPPVPVSLGPEHAMFFSAANHADGGFGFSPMFRFPLMHPAAAAAGLRPPFAAAVANAAAAAAATSSIIDHVAHARFAALQQSAAAIGNRAEDRNPQEQQGPPGPGGVIQQANNHNNLRQSIVTPLRQRGHQLTQLLSLDSPEQATETIRCQLCSNPIKTNRYSNLLNHVRRHAALKQFKCVHCDYQHNETAKVRLHMLHNHDDQESTPYDKWSPKLQEIWEQLMYKCFPNRAGVVKSSNDSDDQEPEESSATDGSPTPALPANSTASGETETPASPLGVVLSDDMFKLEPSDSPDDSPIEQDCQDMDAKVSPISEPDLSPLEPNNDMMESSNGLPVSTNFNGLSQVRPDYQLDGEQQTPPLRGRMRRSIRPHMPATLECRLCSRPIVSHPRQALMNHAKRHCYRKQWRCLKCSYASSETAHVRNHMAAKHEIMDVQPIDTRNSSLETTWNQMFARCFPTAVPRYLRRSSFNMTEDGVGAMEIEDPVDGDGGLEVNDHLNNPRSDNRAD